MYLEAEPEIFGMFGQQLGAYLSPKPVFYEDLFVIWCTWECVCVGCVCVLGYRMNIGEASGANRVGLQ